MYVCMCVLDVLEDLAVVAFILILASVAMKFGAKCLVARNYTQLSHKCKLHRNKGKKDSLSGDCETIINKENQ